MQLVLLGPPGVGKGTQAEKLAKQFEIAHISTGDMFREHVSKQTELGTTAQKYMKAGELVPDEIVIGMVEERLQADDTEPGFLLDGFPRTISQAQALGALLERLGRPLDAVVDLRADQEDLVRRLSSRRVCKSCGATYNVMFKPPSQEGRCDACGGEVIQREDDRPEAIRVRLEEYDAKTSPLTEYYRKEGLLKEVDATGSIDEVFEGVQSSLA